MRIDNQSTHLTWLDSIRRSCGDMLFSMKIIWNVILHINFDISCVTKLVWDIRASFMTEYLYHCMHT